MNTLNKQGLDGIFSGLNLTPSHTSVKLKHLQTQQLSRLVGTSVVFQKRDRTLKNPLYSVIACDPLAMISIKDRSVFVESVNGKHKIALNGCPFAFLNGLQSGLSRRFDISSLPTEIDFSSGLIGYLGFGVTSLIENVNKQQSDPLGVPDAMLMIPSKVVYVDHAAGIIHLISKGDSGRMLGRINVLNDSGLFNISAEQSQTSTVETKSSMSKEDFLEKAATAQKLIHAGQCFQIVLSQRFSSRLEVDAQDLFSTLVETAPSTYNYLLNFPEFQYLGASPETMISAKDNQVRLCALAGTRPRGNTTDQDEKNEVELKSNEKELAEHLMLVDLGRNDLGKICAPGTIDVGPIAQVLRYSNVMHLGTEIFGSLESNQNIFSALKACFPRGTVSGAPKIRALEVLSQLEPEQRGIYAGAVGFFDVRGKMDTAIAIRSALLKNGIAHVNAGAGIVFDSEPEFEYLETVNKASAMMSVIQRSGSPILQNKLIGAGR